MRLQYANEAFTDVRIPVLWGERAILQDRSGALSVIAIEDYFPKVEIVRGQPAPGIQFQMLWSGFQIMGASFPLYSFNVRESLFTPLALNLPEVQISDSYIRVGAQIYPNLKQLEHLIGVHVTASEVQVGAMIPLPLLALIDRRAAVN